LEAFVEQRWFGNWNISSKIVFGFAAILAVNAAIAIYCVPSAPPANGHPLDRAIVPALVTMADLHASLAAYHDAQWECLAPHTEAERRECEKHLREALQAIHSDQEKYGALFPQSKDAHSVDEINRGVAQYLAISQQVVDLTRANVVRTSGKRIHGTHRMHRRLVSFRKSKAERLAADLLSGPAQNALAEAGSVLQKNAGSYVRQWEDVQRASAADAANNAFISASARQRMQRAALSGVGVGLFLTILIAYSIARPIRLVVAAARRIAAGALSEDALILEGSDEAGELGRLLEEIQSRLRAMAKAAAGCGDRIATAGDTISLAATRQSEVRVDLEHALQAAVVVQHLALTVKESSQQFRRAAAQTTEGAAEGASAIETALAQIQATASAGTQTSERMQELVKSSQQIAQELALVEDMARQTNAIALNAGIESARANDKDRGFLIMADEATKIAERTDRTAKEIGRTPGNDARTRREC